MLMGYFHDISKLSEIAHDILDNEKNFEELSPEQTTKILGCFHEIEIAIKNIRDRKFVKVLEEKKASDEKDDANSES
jgi:hypothetical protein